MASLHNKIKLYLEANSKTENELLDDNVVLQDNSDGAGVFIASWNVSGLVEPTAEQLNALESQANTFETNQGVGVTRKTAYGDIGDQLDLLYKDMLADKGDKTGEWFKKIKAVKDANAKS